ncbi:agamous-like MADS-box AGL80 [Olea europaea subsp. europaea]|uniref:Agamous-like MADS-box AGL80 n=1 Tax=Olea europaea subsp. europaea TaxID=158383 RepID=A0A8S0T480_OLEEU|nr:agamous-like MADS-box AGL80 [Olea europaea subsp. europaea]
MGRAKLNMELISKEKSRNITFKKRKEGLMRKMHEFTTLCDVSACMIIYPPTQDKNTVEPEIWPQNLEETRRIIDIYENKKKDSGNKTYGLSDFFNERNQKIEDELEKLRNKNKEAKYPTWIKLMDELSEIQLREFYALLSNKAEYVKSRIEMLKRNANEFDMNMMDLGHGRLIQSGIGLEMINQQAISSMKPIEMHVPIHYPSIDHHQDMHSANQNSMMMLLMNDNDYLQFGGASNGSNVQCASCKRQVFYESTAAAELGVMDNVMCHNPVPLARYYAVAPPVLPPVPPPYVQCAVMPCIAPPQLNSLKESDEQDDVFQYQIKNQKAMYYE